MDSSAPSPRKRPALSTVGRGSRSILPVLGTASPLLAVGTAIAHASNKLHLLALDTDQNTVQSSSAFGAPAEVWSLAAVSESDGVMRVAVGGRRGRQSSVGVWNLREHGNATGAEEIAVQTTVEVDGLISELRQNADQPSQYLAICNDNAVTIEAVVSLQVGTQLRLADSAVCSRDGALRLIGGGWVDSNTAFLASAHAIGTYDTRAGQLVATLNLQNAIESSTSDPTGVWIPPHQARLSSVCAEGVHTFYAGAQDGSVRAFDARKHKMVWEAMHAEGHLVTALSKKGEALLSGGTDGVVRRWMRGSVTPFPQHDETVTGVCCWERGFASVSYDGRVALNEVSEAS